MAETMRERVARAICCYFDELPDRATYSQRKHADPYRQWVDKAEVLDDADAAIRAMREPTLQMEEAAYENGDFSQEGEWVVRPGNAWRAMIDKALEGEDE